LLQYDALIQPDCTLTVLDRTGGRERGLCHQPAYKAEEANQIQGTTATELTLCLRVAPKDSEQLERTEF
jgi:hypothetical protein